MQFTTLTQPFHSHRKRIPFGQSPLLKKKEVETNKYSKRYPLIANEADHQFADKHFQKSYLYFKGPTKEVNVMFYDILLIKVKSYKLILQEINIKYT